MPNLRFLSSLLLLAAAPLAAQQQPAAPVDSAVASETDEEGVRLGMQYGVAAGALHYAGGAGEQAVGVIARYAPVRWFSISATPTGLRMSVPAGSTAPAVSKSGLGDLPVEATVTHAFAVGLAPTISGGFGVSLPLGDSASGFGTGRLGYTASVGLGFSPSEAVWVHLGAGRSLSGLTSAFSGGSGWGDASAGTSLTEKISVSGGLSTDLGAVDPTLGRSTSVNGGVAFALQGSTTLHLNASHGVAGSAPDWSFGIGFGTAFPYLNHLGAGSSSQLRGTFGAGTSGSGSGVSGISGRGRRP
jgi:hypothetical protein